MITRAPHYAWRIQKRGTARALAKVTKIPSGNLAHFSPCHGHGKKKGGSVIFLLL